MDESGNVLDYNSFTLKHGFACHPKQFFIAVNAIPSGIKIIMKCSLSYSKNVDVEIENKLCSNRVIIQSCYPCQILRHKLDQTFDKNTVKYFRTAYLRFHIPPKAK